VVRVLNLQPGGPGFKFSSLLLDGFLFNGPRLTPTPPRLVDNQPVGIFNTLSVLFHNTVEFRFHETSIFQTSRKIETKVIFRALVKRCNSTPDFSNYPIFQTNFRFPRRFEKSGFHQICFSIYSVPSLHSSAKYRDTWSDFFFISDDSLLFSA